MASIYDIDRRITDCIEGGFALDEETGEVWEGAEGLAALQMERRDKVEGVALWIKEQERLADAIMGEETALRRRRKAVEARCKSIREYLAQAVADEPSRRFETARVKLGVRRCESVEVYDEDMVPPDYIRTAVVERSSVDKPMVREWLRAGHEVPGCRLVTRDSLQVM